MFKISPFSELGDDMLLRYPSDQPNGGQENFCIFNKADK
jgi:hypothetical protein